MMLDIENIDSSDGEEDWMYMSSAGDNSKKEATDEESSSSDFFSK